MKKKIYQLNLYPIASHGSCKSQSQLWPLWRPYFCKPCFIVSTIRSTNPSTSRWSCEIMQWSINVFTHNSWNSPQNFVPWYVRTSARTPNLLSNLSKNEYVIFSLLWFGNGTNSNHLEKCSIITKTYQLCKGVKLNGPVKSKLHEYPSPIIGKGYRWSVGTLKDARNRSHTIHLKTNCWTYNCFRVVLGEAQPSLVHLPTFVGGNYLSI